MNVSTFHNNIQSMNNKSQRNRPLQYGPHVNMHSFVHGNQSHGSQAVSLSVPFAAPPRHNNSHPHTSLFDRYNRNNMYLRDCDQRDLIMLTKNIVVHEEALSGYSLVYQGKWLIASPRKAAEEQQANRKINSKKAPAQTDTFLRTAPQVAPSREYAQNEVFFNYKQMGDLKRKQKDEYLTAIEHMVKDAEYQISEIENLQEQEKMERGNLYQQQRQIEQQASKNVRVGLMQQEITAVTPLDAVSQEALHIHEEMEPEQINQILDEHHKLNQDILQRATRARSRQAKESGGKGFGMSMTQGQKLGGTLKKAMGPPKSVSSTAKDGFRPKKNRK